MTMPILFFDIETAPDLDAVAALPEPKAPGNLKDPVKITQAIEEKKAEQAANAALDPDTAQITAIAMAAGGVTETPEVFAYLIGDEQTPDEKTLLALFWEKLAACGYRACGYNIIGFDFPMILRRTMALGVIPTPPLPFGGIQLAKYRMQPILDLMGVLYNWDKARGLKWVCKRHGIPNPLPDLNGSMVGEMDRDTLRKYVANDVQLVVELYRRMAGVYF